MIIACSNSARSAATSLSLEYKNDTLEMEQTNNIYYRNKFLYEYDKNNYFGSTFIYLKQYKRKQYTWNIFLNNFEKNFLFTLGNYYVHFGSGLIISKPQSFSTNVFFIKKSNQTKDIFSPNLTGNPAYSFLGTATSYKFVNSLNTKIQINSFYSRNICYLSIDETTKKETKKSLNNIRSNFYEDRNSNSMVFPVTTGSMLNAQFFNYFCIQINSLQNWLENSENKKISWQLEESGSYISSTNKSENYSFYLNYHDNYLDLFYEHAISKKYKQIRTEGLTDKKNNYSYATQYGFKFKHYNINLSLSYKKSQRNYYAPYSNPIGNINSSHALKTSSNLKLSKNIAIENNLLLEKKTKVTKSNSTSNKTRETYKISAKSKKYFFTESTLKTYNRNHHKTKQEKYLNTFRYKYYKKNYIAFSYILQKKMQNEKSFVYKIKLKNFFLKYNQLTIEYLHSIIKEDNPIYSSTCQLPGSFSTTKLTRSSSIFAINYSYRKNNFSLAINYNKQFKERKTLNEKFEFYSKVSY